jgi:hypothetical protein
LILQVRLKQAFVGWPRNACLDSFVFAEFIRKTGKAAFANKLCLGRDFNQKRVTRSLPAKPPGLRAFFQPSDYLRGSWRLAPPNLPGNAGKLDII